MRAHRLLSIAVSLILTNTPAAPVSDNVALWQDGLPRCRIVVPSPDEAALRLGAATINDFLRRSFHIELPTAREVDEPGTYILLGTAQHRPWIEKTSAVRLTTEDLGDEGFHLLGGENGTSRFIVVYGRTPRAIKHGCQELLYYHLAATTKDGQADWPLNVVMKPAIAYRGVYMLPCWAAHDSFASWQRVLRFHSELTINRNWFWLDGFPVAGHTGEYAGTALADERNVQSLIDLVGAEDMRILIGGGWFNWHHGKAVGKDYAKGIDYYLAYLKAFRGFHGFYIEPTGEGNEIKDWRPECDALRELIARVAKERPDHEFAIAIGRFNNREYLKLMSQCDPRRVYWWWCWGDPIRDKTLDLYPSVLRWHVVVSMSGFHGSLEPPRPAERALAGVVTSYDPGMGFGNPWNGWGNLGADKPRNFDPHNVPYFAHQYHYRERCWNPGLSEKDFVARLHRRLFDADAPADAGEQYWRLSRMTLQSHSTTRPTAEQIAPIQAFLENVRGRAFTPRTADALTRMEEAVRQWRRILETPAKKKA